MLKRRFPGRIDATGPLHNCHDVGEGTAVLVAQGVCDQTSVTLVAHFHGMKQGQGDFPLGQVITDVLAGFTGVAGIVEQVIRQLEGNPKVHAVVA